MPLPKYVSQARPKLTNQRWQQMQAPQRRKIGNQVRQQQKNMAAQGQAWAAAPPSDGGGYRTGLPYTPPESGTTSNAVVPNPQGYSGVVPQSGDYANHPFFDPNSNYLVPGLRGEQQKPGTQDPNSLGFMTYATQNPEEYYYALLNRQGLGGMDARSQTAQGLYGDYARGYGAARTVNQDLWFPEYMGGQNIQGQIGNMSYNQLGIDPNQWSDRSRWGMRGY